MSDIKAQIARLAKLRPAISLDLSIREASIRLLRHYAGQLLCWEDSGRCGSEEGVHQLRLHIRRLRVLHASLQRFLPHRLRAIGHEFRLTSRLLGRIRDLDVFQGAVSALRVKPPAGAPPGWSDALDSLLAVTEAQRTAHVYELIRHFESEDFVAVRELAGTPFFDRKLWHLHAPSDAPPKHSYDAHNEPRAGQRVGLVLPLIVWEAYVKVLRYDRGGEMDSATERDPELLHQLRIDLKHLRYLMDGFRELLGGAQIEDFLREVKALIDAIGAVHDPFVHGETLDAYARQLPAAYHQHMALLSGTRTLSWYTA